MNNVSITKKELDSLLAKLRFAIHINYISSHILRMSIEDTRSIICMLIQEGVIKESTISKDYYETIGK